MSSPGVVVVRITSEFRRVEAEGGCARDSAATVQALEGVEEGERERERGDWIIEVCRHMGNGIHKYGSRPSRSQQGRE